MPLAGEITPTQELILQVIERQRRDNFAGAAVVGDLRANGHLWHAVLMLGNDLLMLRDLHQDVWNADSLYVLTDLAHADELEQLARQRWRPDAIERYSLEETARVLAEGTLLVGDRRVVSVWWD